MIRHVVAFRFRDTVDDEERARLMDEIAELPVHFPVLGNFQLGRNVSTRDDRYSHAFVTDVDTMEELAGYLSSERHERFVAERFKPLVAERAIVSFEVT